jgi:hypothetical protein
VHEYVLLRPVPELDARPGCVLVWAYPAVAVLRKVNGVPQLELVERDLSDWLSLFARYDGAFQPYTAGAPPAWAAAVAFTPLRLGVDDEEVAGVAAVAPLRPWPGAPPRLRVIRGGLA